MDADIRFLHHLLRSAPLIAEYGMRSVGIRPQQWRLYWSDLADVSVQLPTVDRQRRIADFLDVETARIDALIDAKQQMIAALLDSRREVTLAGVAGLMTTEGDRRLSVLHWVWTRFLRSLKDRGLAGVRLVISDAHAGLKASIRKCFTGSSWQRCRVHYARNLLANVPRAHQEMVAPTSSGSSPTTPAP